MNKMKRCAEWVIPAIVAAFFVTPVSAATCTSTGVTSNWTQATTWSCTPLLPLVLVPTATDDVTIANGTTVTVNQAGRAANSVTLAGGNVNANTTLTFNAGSSLAVTNDVTINPPTRNNRTEGITVLAGSLTVGGNVMLTGGTAASRKALLSASTGSITINGGLTITSTVATSSTAQLTSTGAITVMGAAGVANGDRVIIGTGTFNVTNTAATFSNSSATIVAATTLSTGTLNVSGTLTNAAGETITVSSTGNINVGGNWSNGGTFTAGTGRVTFNGTAAQTLGGAATTTFNNLTINNTGGDVTINSASTALSPTVNGALTLTSGHVITTVGTNDLGLGTAGTVSGGSAASHVVGAVQKNYVAAGTLTFPVGDGTNYTPVVIQGTAGFTAGSLTINTTGGDHPSIASSGIDSTKSVNRYWTLTPSGLPASTYNATFNYINGSPVDLDAGATPANFIVEQWNGTNWFPTTNTACTSTQCQITGETGFGDFAIGEPLFGFTALPGQFNAFETTTPAGAVLGMVQTKQSGVALSVRLVRLNAAKNAVDTTYTQAGVTVELLDSSDNTGALNTTTGCRPIGAAVGQWHPIGGTSQTVNFNAGAISPVNFTVANSYRDVRVHVVKTGTGAGEGCSTDRFAIRPQSLTVTAWDATWATAGTSRQLNNVGASGGNVHKAATFANPLPFTLRATPVPATATNYDGNPTTVAGFPACGTLCTTAGALSFTAGSWTTTPAGSGVRENATANYSEAGTFNLQLEDATYASVDAVDGSTPAMRTVPSVASVEIGRFVPDHFALSGGSITNRVVAACAPLSTFTYAGEKFHVALALTAQNSSNNKTANYPVAATAFIGAVPANFGFGAIDLADAIPPTVATPNLNLDITNATSSGSWASGVGTFTADLALTRAATPEGPYESFNLGVAPADADGVTLATYNLDVNNDTINDHGLVAASKIRFGRLKLANAYGSELLKLPVSIQTQYWNGMGFVINAADNCTTLAASNVKLTTPPAGVSATLGGAFSSGVGSLTLSKPTTPANVAVDLCVDLGADPVGGAVCSASASANLPYLQSLWSPGTGYNNDPAARATFGVYKGSNEFIYMREAY